MSIEKIAEKVAKEADTSKEDFIKKVEKKKKELEGLVSDEGAAHIVANEMGIQTLPKPKEPKIEELNQGPLGSITLNIKTVYPPREFTTKKGRNGRVANVIVEDDTGSTRLVLWGRQTKVVGKIGKGGKVRVVNAYVKKGRDGLEVHASNKTRINVIEEGEKNEIVGLGNLEEGKFMRDRATVRKVIAERSFWRCRERGCDYRGEECPEHGECDEVPVVTAVLDNGLNEVRAVFFGDKAEMAKLGNEMYFSGKVKKNDYRDDLEVTVFSSEPINVKEEISRLMKS